MATLTETRGGRDEETLGSVGGGSGDLTGHGNMLDISGFLVRGRKLVHLRGAGTGGSRGIIKLGPFGKRFQREQVSKRRSKQLSQAKAPRFQGADMTGRIESAQRQQSHISIHMRGRDCGIWRYGVEVVRELAGGRWPVDVVKSQSSLHSRRGTRRSPCSVV
jgi:hypothetical protein